MGINVVLVREEDTGLDNVSSSSTLRNRKVSDMKNRLELTKQYNDCIFVSIHMNIFDQESVHGAQVFYSKNVESSLELAQSLQSAIKEYVQPDNNRVVKQGGKDIYLLNNAVVPSVIIECGFLSNNNDLTNLQKEEYQKKIAFSIVCGLIKYYDI